MIARDYQNWPSAFFDYPLLQVVDLGAVFAVVFLRHNHQIDTARICDDAIRQKAAFATDSSPFGWKGFCLCLRIKDRFHFFGVGLLAGRKVLKTDLGDMHGNARIDDQRFRYIKPDDMGIVAPRQYSCGFQQVCG